MTELLIKVVKELFESYHHFEAELRNLSKYYFLITFSSIYEFMSEFLKNSDSDSFFKIQTWKNRKHHI